MAKYSIFQAPRYVDRGIDERTKKRQKRIIKKETIYANNLFSFLCLSLTLPPLSHRLYRLWKCLCFIYCWILSFRSSSINGVHFPLIASATEMLTRKNFFIGCLGLTFPIRPVRFFSFFLCSRWAFINFNWIQWIKNWFQSERDISPNNFRCSDKWNCPLNIRKKKLFVDRWIFRFDSIRGFRYLEHILIWIFK